MKPDHFLIVGLLFVMFGFVSWPLNIYKLTQCDFEAPYKCEAVHGVGVFVAPVSLVTAWLSFEGE